MLWTHTQTWEGSCVSGFFQDGTWSFTLQASTRVGQRGKWLYILLPLLFHITHACRYLYLNQAYIYMHQEYCWDLAAHNHRLHPGSTIFILTELLPPSIEQIANLLGCTSWSGAGPGLMDAATKGALQAGRPVGGFKIGKEAGEWTSSNFHSYLPSEAYLTCR